MPTKKDDATYDQLHERLLRDMLLAIKDELDAADLDHDEVHELTANIALAVSAILDGTSPMTLDGQRLVPFLAFADESRRDELIVNDQGSYLHEMVDTLFEQMDAEGEDEEDDEEEEDDEDEDDDFEYEDEEDNADDEEEEEEEDEDEDAEDESGDDKRRH